MAPKKSKQAEAITVELTDVAPKKYSVRFDSTDKDAAMRSAYVNTEALDAIGGAPNGIRVTIEAL